MVLPIAICSSLSTREYINIMQQYAKTELEKELFSRLQECVDTCERVENLEAENIRLEREIEDLQDEVGISDDELLDEIDQLTEKNEELTDKLEKLNETIENLEDQIASLQEELDNQ